MVGSMFALILGLALLGLAVWLLLRAKDSDATGADGADGNEGNRGYGEYSGYNGGWSTDEGYELSLIHI